MAQQTTIAAVIPRWERFLARWPDIRSLAAASEQEVLEEWTGLGYYSRARNLHKAARQIQARGGFPHTAAELKDLPGFGDYISAAVASIAFGHAAPVLDANVERVASRLLALEENPRSGAGRKALRGALQQWLDSARPGDFNQAMMELGALVCAPRGPSCLLCPVADFCEARRRGVVEAYPKLPQKTPMEKVKEAAALIRDCDGRVLVLQRPDAGSFASMWEIPRAPASVAPKKSIPEIVRRLTNLEFRPAKKLLSLKHTVMRRNIELTVFNGHWSGHIRLSEHQDHRWVSVDQWNQLAKSVTQKKIWEEVSRNGA